MSATTTSKAEPAASGPRAAARSALYVMLTDAAVSPGVTHRFIQPSAVAKVAAGLARHPRSATRWEASWHE